jgi:DNA-binding transcriptional LysR family regulator
MNETNLNWDDLRLFLAVARTGGLSAAANATGKSAPTLGRRMLALEASTGGELFRRRARGYELTEQGSELLQQVVEIETGILLLERAADSGIKPVVKVSAGSWMTHALCQNIRHILPDDAAIRLRFISAEQVLDIAHRETVIGIRNQRPVQIGLACRRIGRVEFAGYASEKDVDTWVRVLGETPSSNWLAEQAGNDAALEVTSPRSALDLARCGVARALLPTFVGDTQEGLARVTPIIAELTHEQWLVTHQDERFRPEVRFVIDRIYEVSRALHGRASTLGSN